MKIMNEHLKYFLYTIVTMMCLGVGGFLAVSLLYTYVLR